MGRHSSMDRPNDQLPSVEVTFHQLPYLPVEIQVKVFEQAAEELIVSENSCCKISHWGFGTHVQVQKTKIFLLPYEDDNMNSNLARMSPKDKAAAERVVAYNVTLAARISLPELLFVNTLARSVMYDTLIGWRGASDGPVELDADLYCEDNLLFGDTSAPDFGVKIQDFRRSGLEDRVFEEYERLNESYQQFMETMGKLERRKRSPGYVILPGNKNFAHPLYGFTI